MSEKKSFVCRSLIIIILFVCAVFAGAFGGHYLGIFKEESICEPCDNKGLSNNGEQQKTDYDSFTGLYSYTGEPIYSEANDGMLTPTYKLYLYENGTFNYQVGYVISMGKIGNYIIKNDTIVLNYFFESSSDAALNVINGEKVLVINSDKSLTDNNQENPIVKEKSIVLKKASDEEEKEYLQNHMSVDDMIRKYDISKILPQ